VLFVDESTVNLHTPLRKCWMRRGQQRRLDAAPGPQAFHHLIGALDWASQNVIASIVTVKNSQTFIEFVEQLMTVHYPTGGVVLVLDNAPYHRSRQVRAALSLFEHRLLPVWLPPYCPTLNPIERFWRHLKDTATANKLFLSSTALLDNLTLVLEAQNQPAHPLRLSFRKVLT
jgi:transposase